MLVSFAETRPLVQNRPEIGWNSLTGLGHFEGQFPRQPIHRQEFFISKISQGGACRIHRELQILKRSRHVNEVVDKL